MPQQPETYTEARNSIEHTVNDPISKILLNHSHLTIPQLETLLSESISNEKGTKKGERRLFRPSTRITSRGSYNRTLIQAQNNVIRSIYTVLLIGYVGLFDSPNLQPFVELSDQLHTFLTELSTTQPDQSVVLQQLENRLLESISSLARRQSFKDKL